MKKIRILIVRNLTIEPLISSLQEILEKYKIRVDVKLSSYDDYVSFYVKNKSNFDYIFIFLSVDGYYESHKINSKNITIIKSKINSDFQIIKNYSKAKNIVYINLNNSEFNTSKQYKIIDRFILKSLSKFEITEQIIFKDKNIYSKKFWKQFVYPFNSTGTEFLSIKMRNYILNSLGKSFKLLILDADNTLWNGVIGEDGFKRIKFKNKNFSFLKFQHDVLNLKKKGILLALCTKNNEKDIKNFFKFSKNKMPLQLKDFVAVKSNWKRKSENISNIIKTINILPSHTAFIDDSHFEINEVKNKIPEINLLKMQHDKIFYEEFKKFFIYNELSNTREDTKKTELYKQEFKREKVRNTTLDFDQYLKQLNLSIIIKINSKKNIDRISQLTQKTNQFNSTTIRMSKNDIKKFINENNNYIFQVEARDIYGDYGIIGLAFLKINSGLEANIINFLFSCRAIGRDIEDYFLYNIIKYILSKGKYKTYFHFKYNEKNKVALEYFLRKKVINNRNYNLQKQKIGINNFMNVKKNIIKCRFQK